jgi:predicted HTH domain antitoxin
MMESSAIEKILKSFTDAQLYVILLLGIGEYKPVKGRLWYQKEMYFVSNIIEVLRKSLEFEPYFIGPHSRDLEEALDQLKFYDMIQYNKNEIELTDFGKEVFGFIKNKTIDKEINAIDEIKGLFNDMSNDELLVFVYTSVDKSLITESLEYERVMRKRVPLAVNLYKKGKVSLGKAAEIAGMTVEGMMQLLKLRNLAIHG